MNKHISRRNFLRRCGTTAGAALTFMAASAPLGRLLANTGGCSQADPHRFIHVFLGGGWDSALATDPVIGSKASSAAYEAAYQGIETKTVPGKDKLIVGSGLLPAVGAFSKVNTAFVNGMWVEVTAHEVAEHYLLSGRFSLSRTREFPSYAALMGKNGGCFPPHVVIGGRVPLGDTRDTTPPLHATSLQGLTNMLAGPRAGDVALPDATIKTAHDLTATLNAGYAARNPRVQYGMKSWQTGEAKLNALYDQRYDTQIRLTEAQAAKYGIEDAYAETATLAGAHQVLASGLTPYVSAYMGGYDTHSGHLAAHPMMLKSFSTAFSAMIEDLRNTPDPSDAKKSLMETTTIVVTSEFVRTPLFNPMAGTDHWPSASAIVMGKGVKDNVVIGATDDQAEALGWVDGKAVPRTHLNALRPEHLAATILSDMGFNADADEISTEVLDELRA